MHVPAFVFCYYSKGHIFITTYEKLNNKISILNSEWLLRPVILQMGGRLHLYEMKALDCHNDCLFHNCI